jgi:hypothetical protein
MIIPSITPGAENTQSPEHLHHGLKDETILHGLQAVLESGLASFLLAVQDYDFQPGFNIPTISTAIYICAEIDSLRRFSRLAKVGSTLIKHRRDHQPNETSTSKETCR